MQPGRLAALPKMAMKDGNTTAVRGGSDRRTGRSWSADGVRKKRGKRKKRKKRLQKTGGGGRDRTGVHGFAGRCITTLLPRQGAYCNCVHAKTKAGIPGIEPPRFIGKHICLLYALAQDRSERSAIQTFNWSGRRVSNSRPQPWQGCALPTELLPHLAHARQEHMNDVTAAYPPMSHRLPRGPAG
jgi:hypothetical protein